MIFKNHMFYCFFMIFHCLSNTSQVSIQVPSGTITCCQIEESASHPSPFAKGSAPSFKPGIVCATCAAWFLCSETLIVVGDAFVACVHVCGLFARVCILCFVGGVWELCGRQLQKNKKLLKT